MFGKTWIFCCITLACGLARAADGPASYSREDVQKYAPVLSARLQGYDPVEQQKAVEIIRQIAKNSPRVLSDNLVRWLEPLLEAKQYQAVNELTLIAINDRAFDIDILEPIQRARVRAFLGEGKIEVARSEAKSYYNIVTLKNTPDAMKLLKQTSSPMISAQGDTQVSAVLQSITVDPSIHDPTIQAWEGRKNSKGLYSFNNLMARGYLLLLNDRPKDAKLCFEEACKADDNKGGKSMRQAIEAIACSIRALPNSSPAIANRYVTNLRHTHEVAGIGLATGLSWDQVRIAAQQTLLAPFQVLTAPPKEVERAAAESQPNPLAGSPVKILTNFESASPMESRLLSPTHIELTLPPGEHHWFIFRVEGAKGRTLRFDLTDSTNGTVGNLISANPMISYTADLTDVNSISAAKSSQANPQQAPVTVWNGDGIFLPDTSGQKWHYIPDVWQVNEYTIGFVTRFDEDNAYVALHAPYTPTYNERYLAKIGSTPDVKIIEIGRSAKNRPLLVAAISAGNEKARQVKPCVLLYAAEMADEHDAMWVAHGAIEYLIGDSVEANQLRNQFTFLVIPVLDPDATAAGQRMGICQTFLTDSQTPESIAYANWFQQWVNAGNRLDIVFNIHGPQAPETAQVASALFEGVGERGQFSSALHNMLVTDFRSAGWTVAPAPGMRGWSPNRLGGWLSRRYGPLCYTPEFISQAPDRHLNLAEVQDWGRITVIATARFLLSEDGTKALANVDVRRQERAVRWARTTNPPSGYDAISAEAIVSKGAGISTSPNNSAAVEKWIP